MTTPMDDSPVCPVPAGDEPLPRAETLISRLVDGEASAREWEEFCTLAAASPDLWRDLAEQQRRSASLSTASARALAPADRVELPGGGRLRLAGGARTEPFRGSGLRSWGGWAIAAGVLVAWWAGLIGPTTPLRPVDDGSGSGGPAVVPAGFVRIESPEDAIDAYLRKGAQTGRVMGELPERIMLEAKPLESAMGDERGVVVVFVRQFVEQAVVPSDAYRVVSDDTGRPVMLPVDLSPRAGRSY